MANGTLALSQMDMLSQSGTGIITIVPPATNTDRTLTLPDSTGTVATLGTSLTLATAVASTSGTSIDFTSIPSWVKRVTVGFSNVSTNGNAQIVVQLGAGSIQTTGYASQSSYVAATSNTAQSTIGMITQLTVAATTRHGAMTFTLVTGNLWAQTHALALPASGVCFGAGDVTLSGALDRVRITTTNGTDTFDAGTINIMYEG